MTTAAVRSWRVLIVDDEAPARRTLRLLLESEAGCQIVAEADHGQGAAAAIREHRPDVMFLDIQMPGGTGLDVLEDVGVEAVPIVVFVTAYDQYALHAFEAHALDYLLKPFSDARFAAVMGRVRRTLANRARSFREGRLVIRDRRRTIVLPWSEIDWIQAEDYCIRIHAGARHPLVRQSLAATLGQLDPAQFVRIHRSTIVNMDRVRAATPLPSGDEDVQLADGTTLRLSRNFRPAFHARLSR